MGISIGLLVNFIVAVVIVGWFFTLLNKSPGEISRIKALREERPDLFWGEFLSYALTWGICLVLMVVLVAPLAIQMVDGWGKISELIQSFL